MLKRAAALLIAFLLLLGAVRLTEAYARETAPTAAQTIPDTIGFEVKAKAAAVIDAANGRVLFAKNANARLPMASTTKIMTAMLTLEQEDPEEWFTVDPAAIRVEGSSMGLREGDRVTLTALAYGMLLPSGNDAANAAAVRIAGSKQAFSELMNRRARELGLEDTHFVTPSGLDDPQHYSSAYDMALLAREALENPRFAEICSKFSAKLQYGNPPYDRWLKNHNRLLKDYPGTVGVKTGFTDSAGRCLVSSAERDGVRLIVVTLGCPDDWRVHTTLYDRYFGLLRQTELPADARGYRVSVTGGNRAEVGVCFEGPVTAALMEGEQAEARASIKPFLYAPVHKGQAVGALRFYCEGQMVAETPLAAADAVDAVTVERKLTFFERLFGERDP